MFRSNTERLKRIQSTLGVEPDGVLGSNTLTALEKKLKITDSENVRSPLPHTTRLTLTRSGIQTIINYEIGSRAYYDARLQSPTWPGGNSGITIGIGYDIGYATVDQFKQDWQTHLPDRDITLLSGACGKKAGRAKRTVQSFSRIKVPYDAAYEVFIKTSVPAYAGKTRTAFPGVDRLHPDAQVALLSLVYNRGARLTGDQRREMKAIHDLVPDRDYAAIANELEKMKRLWEGRGLDGLLKRRDDEAELVRHSDRTYLPDELVTV